MGRLVGRQVGRQAGRQAGTGAKTRMIDIFFSDTWHRKLSAITCLCSGNEGVFDS